MKKKLCCPVIVEGRYDKSTLCSLVEGDVFTTEGFGIFRDRRRMELIRRLGEAGRVIVLTDSDRAGFRIRGAIASMLPPERIIHVYIPQLAGKESRKPKPSAEGTLGVEGMPAQVLLTALEQAGAFEGKAAPAHRITKQMLYELGFSGRENSAQKRAALLEQCNLPKGLGANSLPAVLSRLMTPEELAARAAQLEERLSPARKEGGT